MKVITLEDAIGSLTRRPGLLVGPEVTSLPDTMETLLDVALRTVGLERERSNRKGQHFRAQMDSLAAEFADQFPQIREELCAQIRLLKPSLDIPHLVRAGWSACISLTDDLLFEFAIKNHLDSLPTSVFVTIIDGPGMIPPERTVPIYKLLGNASVPDLKHRLAVSNSELLIRQQFWQQMLKTCPDYMRESPLFVLGCAPVLKELQTVFGVLVSQSRPNISRIVFLSNDPVLKDPTLMALCDQLNVVAVDANLRDLISAIENLAPRRSIEQQRIEAGSPIEEVILRHEQIVSLVPRSLPLAIDRSHLPSLIDGLFRPASLDWQPFAAKLDLRRTDTDRIELEVRNALSSYSVGSLSFVVVRGEAGIGKTTVLKRVAFELAAEGLAVVWCRRVNAGWNRQFRSLATELSTCIQKNPSQQQIVVFCDDPWGLRMDATELMSCFERFAGRIVFVFAWRNTDFFSTDRMPLALQGNTSEELELAYELDADEWQRLAVMLEKIGAVRDQMEANRELLRIPSRKATDILCSLWYLIPETRSQLSESLRDEYCRLGNVRESLATIAQDLAMNSETARRAYEYVTVTSNLDIGLPIEILVRALGINYDEWIDMIVDGRPLWGLLYDDSNATTGDIVFRTRNEIVTRVLLDLVNGGVGHAGEYRVLGELLRACDGGGAIYRNFILDLLVRNRSKLQKVVSYEKGIELFDMARQALVYEDRLLEHHKGIWIDDVGKDSKAAYQQLELALRSDLHPSSDRDAPVEHIHTSMASAIVKLVKSGELDRSLGFEQVRDHLRRASSSRFFNAHTAHVSANLLFELAQTSSDAEDDVALGSIGEALQEIERALQLIGAQGRNHFRDAKSVTILTDLQRRIIRSLPSDEAQKELASRMFRERRSQIGFEVVGRVLFAGASAENKGSSYNAVQVYVMSCIDEVEASGKQPSAELFALLTDLTVRWRVQRFQSVDWSVFGDRLRLVLESVRYRDDVMKTFYYAVALFHLGQVTEANATFAGLRRLQLAASPREIRCYYLGDAGSPKRMQGVLERKHDYAYVLVSELQLSIPLRSPPAGQGSGKIVHPYIAFAINGPTAVLEKPTDMSVQLP